MDRLAAQVGEARLWIADFRKLPTHSKFIVFMPQWNFLNFFAERAAGYPEFYLRMQAEAVELIQEQGAVTGVRAQTPQGELAVHCDLVVGCDGRQSAVRERAGLHIVDKGAPMDILWMHISKRAGDPEQSLGRIDRGRMLAMLNREDYWQCAYVIPKGTAEEIRARGIDRFRQELVTLVPYFQNRVEEIRDWDDVRLLTVKVDCLEDWWKPGLLCIGDAAHAMSPIGGVGINLAVQDAVAAANILAAPLRSGQALNPFLQRVQHRREFPTRVTQRAQILAQDRVIRPVLKGSGPLAVPSILKWMQRWPSLQQIPARAIGLGARPEHVRIPDTHAR